MGIMKQSHKNLLIIKKNIGNYACFKYIEKESFFYTIEIVGFEEKK